MVFWNVEIDKQSSHATTLNKPFGRYIIMLLWCEIRTRKEFQSRQDQGLEGWEGVVCIGGDILVYNEGSTMAQAITYYDHDCCSGVAPGI